MNQLLQTVQVQIAVLALVYVLVVAIVLLDLWAGISKAKRRGEFRSSYGLRKTVDKLCRYLNLMLILTVIDALQMVAIYMLAAQGSVNLPLVPVFSIFGAIAMGFIEIKSVRENYTDKEKARMNEALNVIAKLAKDHDIQDVVGNIVNYIQTEQKNGEE